MTLSIKDGGTWKEAEPYVKDGGSWKRVLAGYVKDAGVWKPFYEPLAWCPPYTVDETRAGDVCYAGIYFDSDGSLKYRVADSTVTATGEDWLLNGANTDVWIKCTVSAGASPTGASSPTGVVLALSGDREWYIIDGSSAGGPVTSDLLIELYDNSGGTGTPIDSYTYSLSAERTS